MIAGMGGGPEAALRATARAMTKVEAAAAVILVEGISDQIAVETAAASLGRDLEAEQIVIVPIGGAHAIRRVLTELKPLVNGMGLAGLVDEREEVVFRRALAAAGIGTPQTRAEMEELGFFVCVADLEEELIRALGVGGVEALLAERGDLRKFRSFQNQPAWRGQDAAAQLRRFVRSSAARNLRYACLLVEAAVVAGALARPLDGVLTAAGPAAASGSA